MKRSSNWIVMLAVVSTLIGGSFLLDSYKYILLILLFLGYIALIIFKIELAVILLFIFSPIMRVPFAGGEKLEIIKCGMTSLIFAAWLIKKVIYKSINKDDTPFSINIFFLALLFWLFITTIHSVDFAASMKTSFLYLSSIMCFYIFCDVLKKEKVLNMYILILFLLGMLISIIAIIQYCIIKFNLFTGLSKFVLPNIEQGLAGTKIGFLNTYRSTGSFYHPNLLGSFIATLIPLGVCMLFLSNKICEKSFYTTTIVLLTIALLCSNSRGAMFSVLCSTAFIAIFYHKKMFKWLVPLAVILLFIYIKFGEEVKLYLRLTGGISYRHLMWFYIIDMIKIHPFLGWGIGTIPNEFLSRFSFVSLWDINTAILRAITEGDFTALKGFSSHNALLNCAAEMGVVGPLLMGWFYTLIFRRAYTAYKTIKKCHSSGILIGFMGVVIGNVFFGIFESYSVLNNSSTNIILMFVVAGIYIIDKLYNGRESA